MKSRMPIAVLLLAAFLPVTAPAVAQERNRPNVLFIVLDDMRPSLGCYGDPIAQTPNIDSLAKHGVVFTRAYCQQSFCSPSRTSALTGCRPDTTEVFDFQSNFRDALPDIVTLPQLFKNNGYETRAFGKVFLERLDDKESWSAPRRPAAGEVYQVAGNRAAGGKAAAIIEASPGRETDQRDRSLTGRASAALEEIKESKKPFFVAVGYSKPNPPFVAPQKYFGLYKPGQFRPASNPNPPAGAPAMAACDWREIRRFRDMPADGPIPQGDAIRLMHGYYACVSFIDAQIGLLVQSLIKLKLHTNTIIVIWSDHGVKLGEYGQWGPQTNYETDTRVPLILCVPGARANGSKIDALVELVDLYPTLADLAGLAAPGTLEGASLRPLLDNPALPWKKAAFSQYPRGQIMGRAMRTERYRYIEWAHRRTRQVEARELYDHQNDPGENTNIAGEPANAALADELSRQLAAGWRAAKPAAK